MPITSLPNKGLSVSAYLRQAFDEGKPYRSYQRLGVLLGYPTSKQNKHADYLKKCRYDIATITAHLYQTLKRHQFTEGSAQIGLLAERPRNTPKGTLFTNVNGERINMTKPSEQQSGANTDGPILLGKTTLRRMVSAVYNETDPLYYRTPYSECSVARYRIERDQSVGSEPVYVYYHPELDESIMTNIEGDNIAGFSGRLTKEEIAEDVKQTPKI